MDPTTALGIAGNTFQFVDFASKLISKGAEYYQSANGALLEQTEVGAAAHNLAVLNEALKDSVIKSTTCGDSAQSSANDTITKGLWDANEQCHIIAQELGKALDTLKLSGRHRGWNSFRQALRSLWSEKKINHLSARLSQAREQLVVYLLVSLSVRKSIGNHLITFDSTAFQQDIIKAIEKSWDVLRQDVGKLGNLLSVMKSGQEGRLLSDWRRQNRTQLDILSCDLQEVVQDTQSAATQDKFLDSLYFTRIEERRERIPEAHKKTFRWVLGGVREDGTRWDEFTSWLQNLSTNGNLFWITGKAGSGKSTLIKFLDESEETKTYLKQWAEHNRLLVTKCFFWKAGTKMQKSYTGLMRTLLHQLLALDRSLIATAGPWRWRALGLGAHDLDEWTDVELKLSFDEVIRKTSDTSRIAIFVDGLDEFDGPEDQLESLTEFLLWGSKFSHVKVCVSSRPWNLFQDVFTGCPSLRLEMLTQSDIKIYVQDTLESNSLFQRQAMVHKASCTDLITEVARKASGVFLWVVLVVRELLKGFRHGQDMRVIRKHVDSIPSDLDAFFLSMIQSIDYSDRAAASRMLQVVVNAPSPLTLMDLSFCDEEREDFALDNVFQHRPTILDVSNRNELMARRLNTLCMGLLELRDRNSFKLAQEQGRLASFAAYKYEVDYLHRTVHDFLLTRESSQVLYSYTLGPFDTSRYFCNAFAVQILLLGAITDDEDLPSFVLGPSDKDHLSLQYIDLLMLSLRQFEANAQASSLLFIERVEVAIADEMRKLKGILNPFWDTRASQAISNWDEWQCTFLTLAVQYGLISYVDHVLSNRPCPWKPRERRHPRPLLHVALWPGNFVFWRKYPPYPAMVRLLLSHGARTDTVFASTSIYDQLILVFTAFSSPSRDYDHLASWSETGDLILPSLSPEQRKNLKRLMRQPHLLTSDESAEFNDYPKDMFSMPQAHLLTSDESAEMNDDPKDMVPTEFLWTSKEILRTNPVTRLSENSLFPRPTLRRRLKRSTQRAFGRLSDLRSALVS